METTTTRLIALGGAALLILLLVYIRWNINTQSVAKPALADTPGLCSNEDVVLQIQRDGLAKARLEVLGAELADVQGSDMDFYQRTFGSVEVMLQRERGKRREAQSTRKGKATVTVAVAEEKPFSSLVYYRIFKSANDYIRSLLTEFVYADEERHRAFVAQNCYDPEQHCLSGRVHYLSPPSVKNLYINRKTARFPFTFVRDPIDRFISAMTEVEFRAAKANQSLPFQHPIGSQLRFQEFVKLILSSGGSRSLFRDHGGIEMEHIAPAIATLLLASKVENQPLKTYRIEQFDSEWRRLSEDIKTPLFNELHRNRTAAASSSDPFGTTLAAKSFLSYASENSYKRFGATLSNRMPIPAGLGARDYEKTSRTYLIALCRIYLTDFMCLNYTLPSECQDLTSEVQEVVEDYRRFRSEDKVEHIENFSDLLRLFLPKSWLSRLAVSACLFTSTPECEARFVHGPEVLGVTDRHEEL